MSRYKEDDNEWDAEDEWESDDGEFAADDEESAATIECPYCQAEIHEDSQRCPFCENYLSREDAPSERKPVWLVVGVVICLILVLLWIWI